MFGFYFNKQEIIDFCKKYNCLDSEINQVLKKSLTNQTQSKFYRNFSESPNIDKIKEECIKEFIQITEVATFGMLKIESERKKTFTSNDGVRTNL